MAVRQGARAGAGPKPGEGPTEEERNRSNFKVCLFFSLLLPFLFFFPLFLDDDL